MEDLIIIIPSHKRQSYLKRVSWYYSRFGCPVYICDSTPGEAANFEEYENINYLHVPELGFYDKILHVLDTTNAKYYALSPDDDFLKLETVYECVNAMRSNPKCSMAVGKQVFWEQGFNNEVFWSFKSANGLTQTNLNVSKFKQTYRFWTHYQNILWSIFRKDAIKESFSLLRSKQLNNQNFIELMLGTVSLDCGFIYVSKNALNYREFSEGEHWGKVETAISPKMYIKSKELRSDCSLFTDVTSVKHFKRSLCFYLFRQSSLYAYIQAFKNKLISIVRDNTKDKYDVVDDSMKDIIQETVTEHV